MVVTLAFLIGCFVGGAIVYRVAKLGLLSMVRSGRLREMLTEYEHVTALVDSQYVPEFVRKNATLPPYE